MFNFQCRKTYVAAALEPQPHTPKSLYKQKDLFGYLFRPLPLPPN